MEDYKALCRQLEAVECSIPTVGLVEETEERLLERISLYQVSSFHAYSIQTFKIPRYVALWTFSINNFD